MKADHSTGGIRAGLTSAMDCQTTTRSRPASISNTGFTPTISSTASTLFHRSATTPRKSSIWAPARASGPSMVRIPSPFCQLLSCGKKKSSSSSIQTQLTLLLQQSGREIPECSCHWQRHFCHSTSLDAPKRRVPGGGSRRRDPSLDENLRWCRPHPHKISHTDCPQPRTVSATSSRVRL